MQMETYTNCTSTDTHLSERTWYCSLGDKYMNVYGKTGHIRPTFTSAEIHLLSQLKNRNLIILKVIN